MIWPRFDVQGIVWPCSAGGGKELRRAACPPPGLRERRKDVGDGAAEQVIKRREGKRSFRRGRPARQYLVQAASGLKHVLPQYGLADPGIARDSQRHRSPRGSRKKPRIFAISASRPIGAESTLHLPSRV
jgi:hypothetical protein